MKKTGIKFWIGIILLTTNQAIGWGALLLGEILTGKTNKLTFSYLGITTYGLSWLMWGTGLLLTGREGLKYSRKLLKKIRHRFIRLFRQG